MAISPFWYCLNGFLSSLFFMLGIVTYMLDLSHLYDSYTEYWIFVLLSGIYIGPPRNVFTQILNMVYDILFRALLGQWYHYRCIYSHSYSISDQKKHIVDIDSWCIFVFSYKYSPGEVCLSIQFSCLKLSWFCCILLAVDVVFLLLVYWHCNNPFMVQWTWKR